MHVPDYQQPPLFLLQCCDEEIATLYKIQEKGRDLVVRDGVTITAEEVHLKQNCPKEWRTLCKTDPASVG